MTDLTIIAGGSKGLGAQLLNIFSAKGHQVIEFSRSGTGKYHIDCDFNETESCQEIILNTFNELGENNFSHINLIINTATLAPFGSLTNAEPKAVKQHLTINIESTLALLQSYLICFKGHKTNTTITYISSGAARRAIPGLGIYSASKAFFERFIDTLAEEQKHQDNPIKCMIINPGVMNTDMQSEIRSQEKSNFPMVDMWNEWHQQGKLADPEDIATTCYRIISGEGENGGYYTAQEYAVKK